MANQERNGRNVAVPDENRPSWRPQDENGQRNRRNMNDDDRDWDMSDERSDRQIERYGQGQSGYGAGRYEGDRSYGSRNQSSMMGDQGRDRGTDERFTGGRGGSQWSPVDRGDRGMHGSHGNYGHTGHWTDDTGGGYLGPSGTNMGYGGQQSQRQGGRGWQGEGGMYGQGGYNEGMYGRGGQQDRFGSQGYQGGYTQRDPQSHHRYGGGRAIGEGRYGHPGQHGYGQGFGQGGVGGFSGHGMATGYSDQNSGYGYQPEHDSAFRGGERGYDDGRAYDQRALDRRENKGAYPFPQTGEPTFSHEAMYGRRGEHRGKGPAGYTRSDDRIKEMVCDVLTDHHEIDASHIEVSVKSGEVTLAGSVEDRRTKRMAEDIIENLSGVKEVVNQLRVSDRRTMTAERTGSNGGPAVEKSAPEQSVQGAHNAGDKRHRA